jgi:hypothetical protein
MAKVALTIQEYYKEFVSILGVITGVVSAIPLTSFIQDVNVFPPLGMVNEGFVMIGSVAVGLLMTLPVFFLSDLPFLGSKIVRMVILGGCIVAMVIGIVIHFHYRSEFMRTVTWAGDKVNAIVSVGKVRTTEAQDEYKDLSDEKMLQKAGATDERLRKLFTPESLDASHTLLYISFVAPLLAGVACGSFAILFVALDKKAAKSTASSPVIIPSTPIDPSDTP